MIKYNLESSLFSDKMWMWSWNNNREIDAVVTTSNYANPFSVAIAWDNKINEY